MGAKAESSSGVREQRHAAELDLVVPFTSTALTRAALDAANRMGADLNPAIRLIRVQVVPYPLQISQSPVDIAFLKEQLAKLPSHSRVAAEIRLARSMEDALFRTLGRGSVVVLASPKRPWTTRNERLAATLRRAGHTVVLVNPGARVAPSLEFAHA
jgi:hypothetical protein